MNITRLDFFCGMIIAGMIARMDDDWYGAVSFKDCASEAVDQAIALCAVLDGVDIDNAEGGTEK